MAGWTDDELDRIDAQDVTNPTDIRDLVASLTGLDVPWDNVPTTGLDTEKVKHKVTALAVIFFGTAL